MVTVGRYKGWRYVTLGRYNEWGYDKSIQILRVVIW